MAEQKPGSTATAAQGPANPTAFWLSLAGVLIQGIAAIMMFTMFSFSPWFGGMMGYRGTMSGYYGMGWYGFAGVWLAVAVISLVLGVLGLVWTNSSSVGKVKNGSVLLLVAAIVAFPMMWGFWVGSTLMFVGAILGLTTTQNKV